MADFNWSAYQKTEPTKFNWDDHEIVGHDSLTPNNQSSVGQTALEHFGNGAALGYLPHLQAAAEKGVDALGEAKDKALDIVGLDHLTSLDHQLRQQGFKLPDETYLAARDANIKRLAKEKKDNPWTAGLSGLAGGVATGIATSGLMPSAGAATVAGRIRDAARAGAAYGAVVNPGDKEGVIDPLQAQDRVMNAGKGALIGAGTAGGVELGSKALPYVTKTIGEKLKALAEKSAVNSTGATGKQASTFSDDAGRELLDRGVVRFGDSQSKIAQRAGQAVDSANAQIDAALTKLDKQGVTVSGDEIKKRIQDKILSMQKDPSSADITRMLNNELENVSNAIKAKGTSEFGAREAEQIKRGYNRKAGNWADPEKGMVGKEMYQTFRSGVEDAAKAADPTTANLFNEGKKVHGLFAPIQEAAERRAATTAQSPPGGLLDVSSAAMGAVAGGPAGAVLAPVARRFISPRIGSSVAVGSDKMSKFLLQSPRLQALSQSNPAAFEKLAAQMGSRVNGSSQPVQKAAGPGDQPVDEEVAKQSFLNGN